MAVEAVVVVVLLVPVMAVGTKAVVAVVVRVVVAVVVWVEGVRVVVAVVAASMVKTIISSRACLRGKVNEEEREPALQEWARATRFAYATGTHRGWQAKK
jgi:uncharacterized oligopeptide transporter (OPT) family protein